MITLTNFEVWVVEPLKNVWYSTNPNGMVIWCGMVILGALIGTIIGARWSYKKMKFWEEVGSRVAGMHKDNKDEEN